MYIYIYLRLCIFIFKKTRLLCHPVYCILHNIIFILGKTQKYTSTTFKLYTYNIGNIALWKWTNVSLYIRLKKSRYNHTIHSAIKLKTINEEGKLFYKHLYSHKISQALIILLSRTSLSPKFLIRRVKHKLICYEWIILITNKKLQ